MVYGTAANVMALAYGGSKSSTPSIVTQALVQATNYINICLNLTEDIASPSAAINAAAESIASEIVKNPRQDPKTLFEFVKMLVGTLGEQVSENEATNWGNMRFV